MLPLMMKRLKSVMFPQCHKLIVKCLPGKIIMNPVELSKRTEYSILKATLDLKLGKIHEVYEDGCYGLHVAARIGNHHMIETFVLKGVDVNIRTKGSKRTALHLAAFYGNLEAVKVLLSCGADVQATDIYGNTALFFCNKNESIMRYLLNYGCPVNHLNKYNESVLHYSLEVDPPDFRTVHNGRDSGICNAITLLITSGADVHVLSLKGKGSLLGYAFYCSDSLELIKLLLKSKLDVLANVTQEHIFMFIACSFPYGCGRLINQFVLDEDVDVDMSVEGKTIFEVACDQMNVDIVSRLLQFDVNIDIHAKDIVSSLLSNDVTFEIVKQLRNHCLKLSAINRSWSPYYNELFSKFECGDIELLEEMCRKEAALLKKIEISKGDSDRRVTCYDVLAGDMNRSVACLRQLDPRAAILKTDISRLPLYGSMVENKLRLASKRLSFINNLEKQVGQTRAFFFALPTTCIDNVMKYLTNGDLRRINEAISEKPNEETIRKQDNVRSIRKRNLSPIPCHSRTSTQRPRKE